MYIKCKLSNRLTTYKNLHYPYKVKQKSCYTHRAVVGIGGNIGDVRRRFERLFMFLKRDKRIEVIETSLILKNPPFGYMNQDDFFNSIIVLRTNMQVFLFLDYLMRLEKKFSRRRSFANAPRTLDLDIIFFDNKIINTKKLTLPHKSWFKRESVVIPLSGVKL